MVFKYGLRANIFQLAKILLRSIERALVEICKKIEKRYPIQLIEIG